MIEIVFQAFDLVLQLISLQQKRGNHMIVTIASTSENFTCLDIRPTIHNGGVRHSGDGTDGVGGETYE